MGSTNEAELVDAEYEHEDTIGSLNRADGQGSEETPAFVSPCGRRTTTAPQEQSDHFLFNQNH